VGVGWTPANYNTPEIPGARRRCGPHQKTGSLRAEAKQSNQFAGFAVWNGPVSRASEHLMVS
jgi:hypothetical protein